MNSLEFYTRQKESWTSTEIEQLRTEYETNGMNISEIADIHQRTPGSIAYKLQYMGSVTNTALVRGYADYKASALYKEIVEKGKTDDSEKRVGGGGQRRGFKNDGANININIQTSELSELKSEVASLRQEMKEMLRVVNMLYDMASAAV
jgi:hypothetical protein